MNIKNALKIQGWMSEKELQWLAEIAIQCKKIIEVGCYQGRSTRAMADNTTGIIYAVDPWNTAVYDNENRVIYYSDDTTRHFFIANLYDKIKDRTVIMFPNYFDTFLAPISALDIDIGMIFIDADHRYDSVVEDIKHAITFSPRIIAGHDYSQQWPGVMKAVDELFPDAQKEESIWWIKLK